MINQESIVIFHHSQQMLRILIFVPELFEEIVEFANNLILFSLLRLRMLIFI